jgi:hypothetical protein
MWNEYALKLIDGTIAFFDFNTERDLADQLVEVEAEIGIPVIGAELVV